MNGRGHFGEIAASTFVLPDPLPEHPPDQDRRWHRGQDEAGPDPTHPGVEPAHADPGEEYGKPHCRCADDEWRARIATTAQTPTTHEPDGPEGKCEAERVQCADARRDDLRVGREDPHELFAEDVDEYAANAEPGDRPAQGDDPGLSGVGRETRADALTDECGRGDGERD